MSPSGTGIGSAAASEGPHVCERNRAPAATLGPATPPEIVWGAVRSAMARTFPPEDASATKLGEAGTGGRPTQVGGFGVPYAPLAPHRHCVNWPGAGERTSRTCAPLYQG